MWLQRNHATQGTGGAFPAGVKVLIQFHGEASRQGGTQCSLVHKLNQVD